MTDDAHRAIFRQILGEGRAPMPADRAPGDGADGRVTLRLETARTVRDDFGLTAVVEECALLRPRLEDLEAEVTPDRLSVLLRGSEGRLGLAVFTPDLALALLEWRLLGMLGAEAPTPRPLTGTDAAILGDLTDPLLARFGAAMAARPGSDWARGFTQGATIEDSRHVPLTLAPGGYHAFRLALRLGEGTRGGELFLALPQAHAPAPTKPRPEDGPPWPDALRSGVLGAELVLNAVLWRMRLSAAEVGRLQPGDLLTVPAAALTAVRLEGPGRVAVAEGRLGQSNGERAVKIAGGEEALPGLAGPALAAPGLAAPAPMAMSAPMGMGDPMGMDDPMAALGAGDDEAGFPVAAMNLSDEAAFDAEAAFSPGAVDFGADFPELSET